MLCCRYALPLITKRFESVKITQKPRNIVVRFQLKLQLSLFLMCWYGLYKIQWFHVCATKGPRPRYPRVWKLRKRIGTVSKSAKLVACVKQLSIVKEEVYGALDSFIAWELEFLLFMVKKALKILQNEQEWKRIIQVIKWMISKGQGRTMGTYFTLLNALAEDERLEEAEELWAKLFSGNLESTPRIFFDKMMSVYYHKDMHEKMFEILYCHLIQDSYHNDVLYRNLNVSVFADMEELGVKPSISVVSMVGSVFQKLVMLEKYDKLKKKYPPPKWEYRYIKGKRVKIQVKQLQEFDKTAKGIIEDKETEEISSLEHEEVEAGSNKVKQLQELEKIAHGVTEDNETKKNSSLEDEEASSHRSKVAIES
ncbi:hypothetical protein V6N13_108645 [Hibiscus sabdariffa]|uniref:Pentatricopeptide repeat-containing protein n=1 Tax=Hibiscus sabdariffa TaxID=183260 RepID=A0ABR2STF2_9ROSI